MPWFPTALFYRILFGLLKAKAELSQTAITHVLRGELVLPNLLEGEQVAAPSCDTSAGLLWTTLCLCRLTGSSKTTDRSWT